MLRWRDVAEATGRRVDPLVQWWRLIDAQGSVNRSSELWDGDQPNVGVLDPPDNQRLLDLLSHHTSSTEDAYFALWDGWGFFYAGAGTACGVGGGGRTVSGPAGVASTVSRLMGSPRLRLPGSDYVVLSGSLREASTIPDLVGARPWTPSANFVWPQDRSWCVVTDVDFDSTLIGCGRGAATAILECGDLEAFPVDPGDSLQCGGDLVNT